MTIKEKRLVYINKQGGIMIGGQTFSATLPDHAILCAFHEIGKTEWFGGKLYLMKDNIPAFQITVDTFYTPRPSWLDVLRHI